jgi:hypothetical protein
MIWSTAIAAMVFFGELYVKAILWGLQKIQQIPSVLRLVASTIRTSIIDFVGWAKQQVLNLVQSVVSAYKQTAKAEVSAISSAYNSSKLNGSTSPKTIALWARALVPLVVVSIVVNVAILLAATMLGPIGILMGSLAVLIVDILATSLGISLSSAAVGTSLPGHDTWNPYVNSGNNSTRAQFAAARPACAPDSNLLTPLFLFLAAWILPTYAAAWMLMLLSQGPPAALFASGIAGILSLAFVFIMLTVTLSQAMLFLLEALSIVVAFVSLISDLIAGALAAGSNPAFIAPAGIIGGVDGAVVLESIHLYKTGPC